MNIVQAFLNDDRLYHAIVDLPINANFLGAITTVATHPKFKVLEDNVAKLMNSVSLTGSPIDSNFDVNQLWSDSMTFSKSGYLFCGKPFPRNDNIRFVDRILYQEDHKGANSDELDVMPSNLPKRLVYFNENTFSFFFKKKISNFPFYFSAKYCKQLYLDVTNTNNGKITWNYIKPIIQGKFLYGPTNGQTDQIIKNVSYFFVRFSFTFMNTYIFNAIFLYSK